MRERWPYPVIETVREYIQCGDCVSHGCVSLCALGGE